jgi:SAM-dependent methyltransferase
MAACLCGAAQWSRAWTYTAPPEGEVRFPFSASGAYRREIHRCGCCGHLVSSHAMDAEGLYQGEYVSATYGDDGIERAFERIAALDPAQSDNAGRVSRVLAFAAARGLRAAPGGRAPSILDVGSGLCVFLHRMKAAGWRCTALDPDPRAAAHASRRVGVASICAEFMSAPPRGRFDAVAFNKVLEHVKDPTGMLARALEHLAPGGFVYLEVPDGECASLAGPAREEFFIDHWHIFSAASLVLLAGRAGFRVEALERLREPSGKYTLRAFASLADASACVSAGDGTWGAGPGANDGR